MLIQKYQSSWASDFEAISKVLREAFQGLPVRIEHIGSTSVENLAAKPIIDIDVVYPTDAPFEQLSERLERIGYFHNGDQGIKGREVFKRKKSEEKHRVLDFIRHHLYVCQVGSEELQRHIAFRDFLRAHEKERMEYERMKYEIAEKAGQEGKIYAEMKESMAGEFVESVLEKHLKSRLNGGTAQK